jgi:hypothetical protein
MSGSNEPKVNNNVSFGVGRYKDNVNNNKGYTILFSIIYIIIQ